MDQAEPDIGKLVSIWETESHEKKIEVVWFFRPSEITNWLGDIRPLQREIFLGCGHGNGLSNLNSLEAIAGKCNVVCLSKDRRNPQPTEKELRKADYIYCRTFDVGKYIVSENFPSSIGGFDVEYFFNMKRCTEPRVCSEPKAHPKVENEKMPVSTTKNDQSTRVEKGTSTSRQINSSTKNGLCARAELKRSKPDQSANPSGASRLKKRKLLVSSDESSGDDTLPYAPPGVFWQEKRVITKDSCRENQDPFIQESLDNKASKLTVKEPGSKQHVRQGISYKYIEVTRRPGMDSSKWLKLEVWSEERLSEANEKETLVVLENMDSSFTSAEVEDIIWTVFEQRVKAKMVQPTAFSSPHSGQALVIFKTNEAADKVISELTHRCLVLGDGRPIVGRRRILKKFSPSGKFPGHLSIDKTRLLKRNDEMKNAVATSHHAQGNTIEFEMAMEWRLLQEQSDLWWRDLREEQGKETEALMKQMKSHHNE
ncbi:hypothetical protein ACS0TY_006627 [Phlomoides rotata]